MNPEAAPWWAVIFAGLLGLVYAFEHYTFYKFEDPEPRQFNQPQIDTDSWRFGSEAGRLEPHEFQTGQLVRFRTGRSGGEVTSRIVAVQGQRVKIEEGEVWVDGAKFQDTYVQSRSGADFFPELIVPEAHVFVLNDMRWRDGTERKDSRSFGPVPVRAIAKVFAAKPKKEGRVRRR